MWKVNDLSRLTGVSARTLHHYDAIGLLRPSHREANGYRVYAEHDLVRLQQIVALKFLGFSLKQIVGLLKTKESLNEQLQLQSVMLAQKIEGLRAMQRALSDVLAKGKTNQTLSLEETLKLIEVYRMNDSKNKEWANSVMQNHEEAYAKTLERVKEKMHDETVLKKMAESATALQDLIDRITPLVGSDPTTPQAYELCDEWFGRLQEAFMGQVEPLSLLQNRKMLAEADGLPFDKKLADWMILVRTCKMIRYSWLAKMGKKLFIMAGEYSSNMHFQEMIANGKRGEVISEEARAHLSEDPTSVKGIEIGRKWIEYVDVTYAGYPELSEAVQQAFVDGIMPSGDEEVAAWLRKAVEAAR